MTRFLVVVAGTILALKMIEGGALSVQFAILLMLGIAFLAAAGSKAIGFVVALFGVLWFAAQASGGDIRGGMALLSSMLPLLMLLFGFYVMFGGMKKRNQ